MPVLIMAGAAGAGKTTELGRLAAKISAINALPCFNPDHFTEDPSSSLYKNLAGASAEVKRLVDASVEEGSDFVWDTTAANWRLILQYADAIERPLMLMVFVHPVVALLQNAKRDRTVSFAAVLETWSNVYGSARRYHAALGERLVICEPTAALREEYSDEIRAFDQAAAEGAAALASHLEELREGGGFRSSYRRDDGVDGGLRSHERPAH